MFYWIMRYVIGGPILRRAFPATITGADNIPAKGPVILARSRPRMIVLGFHPGSSALKFDLATPLLFANIFRWRRLRKPTDFT